MSFIHISSSSSLLKLRLLLEMRISYRIHCDWDCRYHRFAEIFRIIWKENNIYGDQFIILIFLRTRTFNDWRVTQQGSRKLLMKKTNDRRWFITMINSIVKFLNTFFSCKFENDSKNFLNSISLFQYNNNVIFFI